MKWNKTDRGTVVNLWMIKKMLGSQNPVTKIDKMMYDSYLADLKWDSKTKAMSYSEYLNSKRQWLASVMGKPEFF